MIDTAATIAMKPRNHAPIEDCVKLWIELITPLRVRNVPKSARAERARDEHDVPDPEHVLLLLDHHGVEERGSNEPGHQSEAFSTGSQAYHPPQPTSS